MFEIESDWEQRDMTHSKCDFFILFFTFTKHYAKI